MMDKRKAVVDEAMTWLRTPFHHAARVKGAGVDCANFLVGVYSAVGLAPDLALGYYPPDWHMHRDEKRFLSVLLEYCDKLPDGEVPQPGDIAMFNYGRHAAHGAIVTGWPVVCHAWLDVQQVTLTEADTGPLADRLAGFYRLRGIDA